MAIKLIPKKKLKKKNQKFSGKEPKIRHRENRSKKKRRHLTKKNETCTKFEKELAFAIT